MWCGTLQAVKIMVMLTAFMAFMWCFGLLPSQQEQAALEARLLDQERAQAQAAGDNAAHTEL